MPGFFPVFATEIIGSPIANRREFRFNFFKPAGLQTMKPCYRAREKNNAMKSRKGCRYG